MRTSFTEARNDTAEAPNVLPTGSSVKKIFADLLNTGTKAFNDAYSNVSSTLHTIANMKTSDFEKEAGQYVPGSHYYAWMIQSVLRYFISTDDRQTHPIYTFLIDLFGNEAFPPMLQTILKNLPKEKIQYLFDQLLPVQVQLMATHLQPYLSQMKDEMPDSTPLEQTKAAFMAMLKNKIAANAFIDAIEKTLPKEFLDSFKNYIKPALVAAVKQYTKDETTDSVEAPNQIVQFFTSMIIPKVKNYMANMSEDALAQTIQYALPKGTPAYVPAYAASALKEYSKTAAATDEAPEANAQVPATPETEAPNYSFLTDLFSNVSNNPTMLCIGPLLFLAGFLMMLTGIKPAATEAKVHHPKTDDAPANEPVAEDAVGAEDLEEDWEEVDAPRMGM